MNPLADRFQSKKLKIKAEGFVTETFMEMLNSIKMILPVNLQLVEELRQRIQKWSPEQLIGDVFQKMVQI